MVLGINFSPLSEPWEKQKLVLGVLYHFFMTYPLSIIALMMPFVLLFTFQWHILLLYAIWYYFDKDSPRRGGYASEWVQRWTVHKWFADYFPVTLHKTVDLSPNHVGAH
ncbi:hypothetical protein COOONC_22889 [Cooperia oncophora]